MGFPPGYRLSVRAGAPWCHDRQPSPRGPKLPRLACREALPGLATMAREVTCTRQAPGNRTARAFPCQPQRVRGCRLPRVHRRGGRAHRIHRRSRACGATRPRRASWGYGPSSLLPSSPDSGCRPCVCGPGVGAVAERRRAPRRVAVAHRGPRAGRVVFCPPTIGFPAGAESRSHTDRDVRSTPAHREQ